MQFVEKIKTHILYSATYFSKSSRLCDKVKNMVKPERPQLTIWYMRIKYWIIKATRAQAHVLSRASTHPHRNM
jgi:hypothetical protein